MAVRIARSVLGACALLVAGGCVRAGEPDGVGDGLTTRRGGIIQGTPVRPDDTAHAFLRIALPGSGTRTCSGELLRPDWVLTARHCVPDVSAAQVTADTASQVSPAAELVLHPDLDVALIRLARPLTVNPALTSLPQQLFPGPIAAMDGQVADCFGYGRNTVSGGAGTLRTAALTLRTVLINAGLLVVYSNDVGQIPWSGDSGGSCLFTHQGRRYLTGVFSTCTALVSPFECHQVAAPVIEAWVRATARPRDDARAAAVLEQGAAVTVTMENTGRDAWTGPAFALVPSNPAPFGLAAVALQAGETVAPGATRTFRFQLRPAPGCGDAAQSTRFQMAHDGALFGEPTAPVVRPPPRPAEPPPEPPSRPDSGAAAADAPDGRRDP
jgi:hypothetical protein